MLNTTLKTRLIMIAVVFVLAFALQSSAQTPRDRAITLIREGNTLFDKEDFEGAKTKYFAALEADTEFPITYWHIGRVLAKLHDHKIAAQAFVLFYTKGSDFP